MADTIKRYYNLVPPCGWDQFIRNPELANYIYDTCLPKVNEGGWSYINPMSGIGIFEDQTGNYFCLDTVDKGGQNLISEMHIGLNQDKISDIVKFTLQIEANFGLLRSTRE